MSNTSQSTEAFLTKLLGASSIWLGAAILCALYIAYKSLTPMATLPAITHIDKVMHFAAYFGLGILFTTGLPRRNSIAICLGVMLLGGAIELLQHFMNMGRSGSWLDAAANGAGAIIGTALASYVINQWFSQRSVQQ